MRYRKPIKRTANGPQAFLAAQVLFIFIFYSWNILINYENLTRNSSRFSSILHSTWTWVRLKWLNWQFFGDKNGSRPDSEAKDTVRLSDEMINCMYSSFHNDKTSCLN